MEMCLNFRIALFRTDFIHFEVYKALRLAGEIRKSESSGHGKFLSKL
jgi:hypothetical protein